MFQQRVHSNNPIKTHKYIHAPLYPLPMLTVAARPTPDPHSFKARQLGHPISPPAPCDAHCPSRHPSASASAALFRHPVVSPVTPPSALPLHSHDSLPSSVHHHDPPPSVHPLPPSVPSFVRRPSPHSCPQHQPTRAKRRLRKHSACTDEMHLVQFLGDTRWQPRSGSHSAV